MGDYNLEDAIQDVEDAFNREMKEYETREAVIDIVKKLACDNSE